MHKWFQLMRRNNNYIIQYMLRVLEIMASDWNSLLIQGVNIWWGHSTKDIWKKEKEECIFLNISYRITVQYFKIVVLLCLSSINVNFLLCILCKFCIFRILNCGKRTTLYWVYHWSILSSGACWFYSCTNQTIWNSDKNYFCVVICCAPLLGIICHWCILSTVACWFYSCKPDK
jgi:hypothetical protein